MLACLIHNQTFLSKQFARVTHIHTLHVAPHRHEKSLSADDSVDIKWLVERFQLRRLSSFSYIFIVNTIDIIEKDERTYFQRQFS